MKVVAINASPRKGWNTELLVREAAKGAAENGAEIEYVDLYRLDKFSGCVSCFGCKREPNKGKCICKDGLTETLEHIRNADALIVGSPVYFGDLSSGFRAFFERVAFQYITYNTEKSIDHRKIPVLLLASGNIKEENVPLRGFDRMLESYKNSFSTFIGPTEYLYVGDTLQVKDYSLYDWNYYVPEEKARSRAEKFPKDLQHAFEAGKALLNR